MTRVVYVNGRYLPYANARVHVEDRGFQFADAVYEVCEVRDGGLVDMERHLQRLQRSLRELGISPPLSEAALRHVLRETIRRNRVSIGFVYMQVSRGVAPRDFALPPADTRPTLVCLARAIPAGRADAQAVQGIAVITAPDIRWGRCDIKTVMLLPAVLAKEAAHQSGAKEAWLVDQDGYVTEGSSSNAWIVTGDGRLVTRELGHSILPGVTRATLIDVLRNEGLQLEARAFTPDEARAAAEAFITSATNTVMPVVSIDGAPIGNGQPGPITLRLRELFRAKAPVSK